MARELRLTGLKLRRADDLMHGTVQALARTSSALRDFAVELGRISNDRGLFGPATGSPNRLPAVQAGLNHARQGILGPGNGEHGLFHAIGSDERFPRRPDSLN